MKLKTITLGIILSVMSSTAFAADGYKNVKFGSSVETVLASKLCSLQKYKSDTHGMDSYACQDFVFSGQPTLAMAIFLNGKFQRFAISLNTSATPVLEGLTKKYGPASSSSTAEEMDRAAVTGDSIFVRFDNDTVFVQGNKNLSTGKDEGILVYTTPQYDKELLALQAKSLRNDL
ncbi:hypothetical protein H4F69_14960 [Pectobacterium brasiliense]|uniref:hypothetical protein n=1 Tax=Pectobacterium brasiliense TaxID=180957 RepID=UPI001968E0CC|nr:hypothetical protein [Pectobacterium brasiliense]MBN3174846.1 hypothetical protein [Pectobacterium brasiliense]MBN3200781.1 hypothetical protein [Pectobacterium brasiliense]MBN3206028.1 hypothetical protein [Pectobacterium brasiliense]